MTFQDILEYVKAEPFRPFRIQMAGGRTFDIRHPENIKVGLSSVHVFLDSEEDERVYERVVMLGFSLMESVEPIDASMAQDQK